MTYNILYFDDEPHVVMPLVESLRSKGLKMTFVAKIEDFFSMLEGNIKFDLIILDVMSPIPQENSEVLKRFNNSEINMMQNGHCTGEVLLMKLKELNDYKNIPVLFYTIKRNIKTEFKNCDYIRKPEVSQEVYERIIELITHK